MDEGEMEDRMIGGGILRNSIVGIWGGSQAVAVKPETGGFRGVRNSVMDAPFLGQFPLGEVGTELPAHLLISIQ